MERKKTVQQQPLILSLQESSESEECSEEERFTPNKVRHLRSLFERNKASNTLHRSQKRVKEPAQTNENGRPGTKLDKTLEEKRLQQLETEFPIKLTRTQYQDIFGETSNESFPGFQDESVLDNQIPSVIEGTDGIEEDKENNEEVAAEDEAAVAPNSLDEPATLSEEIEENLIKDIVLSGKELEEKRKNPENILNVAENMAQVKRKTRRSTSTPARINNNREILADPNITPNTKARVSRKEQKLSNWKQKRDELVHRRRQLEFSDSEESQEGRPTRNKKPPERLSYDTFGKQSRTEKAKLSVIDVEETKTCPEMATQLMKIYSQQLALQQKVLEMLEKKL